MTYASRGNTSYSQNRVHLPDIMVSGTSKYFEMYDFTTADLQLHQNHLNFKITNAATINSLTCFIYIDMGGCTGSGSSRHPKYQCETYPYGDDRLNGKPQTISFSSNTSEQTHV